MDDPVRKSRRRQAWKAARAAVQAYERDQSPANVLWVEAAMQELRHTQGDGLRQGAEPK